MAYNLLLNQTTEKQLDNFLAKPSHALLVIGPSGAGKRSIGRMLSAKLLEVNEEKLDNQPFFIEVNKPEDKQNISIDTVREITKFLKLRVPSTKTTNRVILIEGAGNMTAGAQNALLKSLEEPPAGTAFILTAGGEQTLLPTIASRSTKLTVRPIGREAALKYFKDFPATEVEAAWNLSQGLAGLLTSLLGDESHELKSAVKLAKKFLGQNVYERLLELDTIASSKTEFGNFLIGLGKVLQALYKSPSGSTQTARLTSSMEVVLKCRRDLSLNVSPRLIALSLALNLKV